MCILHTAPPVDMPTLSMSTVCRRGRCSLLAVARYDPGISLLSWLALRPILVLAYNWPMSFL